MYFVSEMEMTAEEAFSSLAPKMDRLNEFYDNINVVPERIHVVKGREV